MTHRFGPLLPVVSCFLLLASGCGDSAGGDADTASSSSSSTTSVTTGGDGGGGGDGAGGGGAGGSAGPQAVAIAFEARVGEDALACGTVYPGLGAEVADVEFVDLRFYVHDVRLVTAGGDDVPVVLEQDEAWQHEGVALLDFEDATGACAGTAPTNTAIVGAVPAGDYVGLKFRLGVPFELNHEDAALSPSPLNLDPLFWNWGFGHIFFKLDTLATPAASDPNEHSVHLGSVGCEGDPELGEVVSCDTPNRPEYAFEAFDAANGKVVLDLAALIADSNLATEVGCHSFPETPACTAPFAVFGLDYATGEPMATQGLFTVE